MSSDNVMNGFALTSVLAAVLIGLPTGARSSEGHHSAAAIVNLPPKSTETIPSPDGRWALVAAPERTVTLENRAEHTQSLVKTYDRSAEIGWNPGSQAFFFNDAYVSNLEDAFIYWVDAKTSLSLDDVIRGYDPEANAMPADHAYFQVARWLDAHRVLVEYCGHNGDAPAQQFDFLYEVSLAGSDKGDVTVHRISRKVGPLNLSSNECRF